MLSRFAVSTCFIVILVSPCSLSFGLLQQTPVKTSFVTNAGNVEILPLRQVPISTKDFGDKDIDEIVNELNQRLNQKRDVDPADTTLFPRAQILLFPIPLDETAPEFKTRLRQNDFKPFPGLAGVDQAFGQNYLFTGEIALRTQNHLPAPPALKAAIQELGFELVLDSENRPGRMLWKISNFDESDIQAVNKICDLTRQIRQRQDIEYCHPSVIYQQQPRENSVEKLEEKAVPLKMQRNRRDTPATFANQWHLENTGQGGGLVDADIDANDAWALATGNPSVTIAIVDEEGIEYDHPNLSANYLSGRDFEYGTTDPAPQNQYAFHGTAVAGLAVAKNNSPSEIRGSCPDCSFKAYRMGGTFSPTRYATALDQITADGADVIANSWNYSVDYALADDLVSAIEYARDNARAQGCVVLFPMPKLAIEKDVCIGTRPYLTAIPGVIAVGGASNENKRISLIGRGNCGCVMGPTGNLRLSGNGTLALLTTDLVGSDGISPGDYYDRFQTTSGATPVVAGVCGLILSQNSTLTGSQVKYILEQTAEKIEPMVASYDSTTGFSSTHGHGRVNAGAAVAMASTFMMPQPFAFTCIPVQSGPANCFDSRTATYAVTSLNAVQGTCAIVRSTPLTNSNQTIVCPPTIQRKRGNCRLIRRMFRSRTGRQ